MSGWGLHDYAGVALVALFLLSGLVLVLRRPQLGQSWWTADRLHGLLTIVIGLTYVGNPAEFARGSWAWILLGSLILAAALWLLLVDPIFEARRMRDHDAELASLARHADAYSAASYDAELRALQAAMPSTMARRHRIAGAAFLTLVGGAFLALGLIGARS